MVPWRKQTNEGTRHSLWSVLGKEQDFLGGGGGGGGGKGGSYSSLKLFYPPEVGSPEFNFVQVINPPKPN